MEAESSVPAITGGIVVGHDGSGHADRALRWAARLARRTDLPLHVIRCWVLSTAPRPASWSPGYAPPQADFEAAVRADLERAVAGCDLVGVSPVLHVVHGTPGRKLVEATPEADLLVVSKRGRGGFMGLVLGSTTDQVVRHARCPVVVIPPLDERDPVEPDRLIADPH